MKKILFSLLIFTLASIFYPANVKAVMDCQSISLNPNLPVYKGGENITVTVTGSADTQRIDLFWKAAYLPMNQAEGWNQINGTYDNDTKTFTAQWTVPSDPQEIILAVNNFGPAGWCSGNPCSLSCPGGSFVYSGGPAICASQATCCSGCQKKIVVDPLRDLNSKNAIDLKDYLKFDPGNYWEYKGINKLFNPPKDFSSRFEVEQPTIMCGHKATAIRHLKDNNFGYWGAAGTTNSSWSGKYALRFSLSNFAQDSKWSDRFTGAPWFIGYDLLDSPNQFKNLGQMTTANTGWLPSYTTTGSQHFYYAPYLFAPRFLPNESSVWHFKRRDATPNFNFNILNDACKYETVNDYNDRDHGWEIFIGWENIEPSPSFPLAYTGRVLKITFYENNASIREDWLFARNIGLVMVKTITLNGDNCGGVCTDTQMINPEVEMRLTKKYIGESLGVSSLTSWVRPGLNSNWSVSVSNNYTGFVDANVDRLFPDGTTQNAFNGYWDGVWVQDGNLIAPVPENSPRGTFIYKFRRHMPDVSSDKLPKGEVLDSSFTNNLPWSNPVTVSFTDNPTVTPTPIPGDLDKSGKVDIFDYNFLVQNFGRTRVQGFLPPSIDPDIVKNDVVDIYDYNILVGNFGKTQ